MAVEHGGYLTNPEVEKQKVDSAISAAINWGCISLLTGTTIMASGIRPQAQKFFAEIAQQYGKYPNIIYETYNEPLNNVSWADSIKPYHEAVIATIRKYDTKNMIVCGTRTWSQDVDEASLDPIKGDNIAYSLHYYASTHKQELRDKAELHLRTGLPCLLPNSEPCLPMAMVILIMRNRNCGGIFLISIRSAGATGRFATKRNHLLHLNPGPVLPEAGMNMLNPSGILVRSKLRGEDTVPAK